MITFGGLKIGDVFEANHKVGLVTYMKVIDVYDIKGFILNAVDLDFDRGLLVKFDSNQEVEKKLCYFQN